MRQSGDGGIKLRKKIYDRLSFKVFIITFLVQILAGALICIVLYYGAPETHFSTAQEDTVKTLELTRKLATVTPEEGGRIIDDFIRDNDIDVAIYDYEKSTAKEKVFADTTSNLSLKTKEEVDARMQADSEYKYQGTLSFWFSNGDTLWLADNNTRYELAYFFHDAKQNILPRTITRSIPLMACVITGISLVCSLIYTLLFARPVRKLSEVSRSMAQMDFSRKCKSKRKDEIGDLARDLDTMSESLDEKIRSLNQRTTELEEEVTRRRELESQKDMFFSAASHELKTPVTVLEGQIRGMIEGVGPYEDHDVYLGKALGTVKRMESLINEILTASRMQSGKEIISSRTDMVQLLEEKMEECEELYEARGIKMELSFENDLVFEGNKDLTSMALGAFLSNAAFYSGEGTVVYVDGEKTKEHQIRVTIRNTGAHIEEEELSHLFEAFYRTDRSRSRRSGGSGLGLYLARLIVEKQGGSCKLENEGEDVLATIELPAAESESSDKK